MRDVSRIYGLYAKVTMLKVPFTLAKPVELKLTFHSVNVSNVFRPHDAEGI